MRDRIKKTITSVDRWGEVRFLRLLALRKGPFLVADFPDAQDVATTVVIMHSRSEPRGARRGEYTAAALVCDVRVKLPSTEEKSDAIAVSLNHRDNCSVVVLFPYKIDGGELILGAVFAQEGEADIFPAQ